MRTWAANFFDASGARAHATSARYAPIAPPTMSGFSWLSKSVKSLPPGTRFFFFSAASSSRRAWAWLGGGASPSSPASPGSAVAARKPRTAPTAAATTAAFFFLATQSCSSGTKHSPRRSDSAFSPHLAMAPSFVCASLALSCFAIFRNSAISFLRSFSFCSFSLSDVSPMAGEAASARSVDGAA